MLNLIFTKSKMNYKASYKKGKLRRNLISLLYEEDEGLQMETKKNQPAQIKYEKFKKRYSIEK